MNASTIATAIAALEFMLSNRRVVRPLPAEVARIEAAIAELEALQADSAAARIAELERALAEITEHIADTYTHGYATASGWTKGDGE